MPRTRPVTFSINEVEFDDIRSVVIRPQVDRTAPGRARVLTGVLEVVVRYDLRDSSGGTKTKEALVSIPPAALAAVTAWFNGALLTAVNELEGI